MRPPIASVLYRFCRAEGAPATVAEVADVAGVDPSTVYDWTNGRADIKALPMQRLRDAFEDFREMAFEAEYGNRYSVQMVPNDASLVEQLDRSIAALQTYRSRVARKDADRARGDAQEQLPLDPKLEDNP